MLDLFPKPWADLDLAAVEQFFADAGEEGTTWEAKADDERGILRPDSARKAANGLANRIGGYVIIGATRDKKTRVWSVPGIESPDDEPESWIGKVLRRLNPAPRFEPNVWHRDDGRIVAVVWVDPVDVPPCMTPQGQVYERVSGETLPVQDPARLDALFRRGEHSRARAEQFADRAATRALDVPGWDSTRAVGVSVALASIGRDTDDIAARLFVPSFRKVIVEMLWRFFAGGHGALGQFAKPDNIVTLPQQDAFAVFAEFDERHVLHPSGGAHRQPRSAWMLQATWDGAVAASAVLSPAALEAFATFDQVVIPGWREVVPLVQQLGGYGVFGDRGEQVQEFKVLVRALHAAGIEVILDVVYNHTAEGDELGPTLCFRGIDNPRYYRLAEDRASYVDYTWSGCATVSAAATTRPAVKSNAASGRSWASTSPG